MNVSIFFSFVFYFSILAVICYLSYRKKNTAVDFILGNRSTNYWITAISAHASDMSSWLFMGLPATIYLRGGYNCWAAIGLFLFMFLNWHFIAPKLRQLSEETNSLTIPSLFETHLKDHSGIIRITSAILSLFFFSFYISSGMIGMGFLFESVFNINYHTGISIAIFFIMIYTFIGGYTTIAWTDFFQGLFLLFVIIFVPLIAFTYINGTSSIIEQAQANKISLSLLPDFSIHTFIQAFITAIAWGLGYFGQPHILNKFMGINNTRDMYKSKYIGMTWHFLSLTASIAVGYISIAYFKDHLVENTELIFVNLVQDIFPSFLAGFILCAILAATISTIDSQILVLSSVIEEDIYKKTLHKNSSSQQQLIVSRISIIVICLLSYFIAFNKSYTVYELVFYAWSGLGASFGPILILTLYFKPLNYYGATTGIILGGVSSALWHTLPLSLPYTIPAIIPGFAIGILSAILISLLSKKKLILD